MLCLRPGCFRRSSRRFSGKEKTPNGLADSINTILSAESYGDDIRAISVDEEDTLDISELTQSVDADEVCPHDAIDHAYYCESKVYLNDEDGLPYHRGTGCCAPPNTPAWKRDSSIKPHVQTRFIDDALGLSTVVTEMMIRPRVEKDDLSTLFWSKEDVELATKEVLIELDEKRKWKEKKEAMTESMGEF